MSKNRDTKPESSNTAELRPEQRPGSASHVSPSPGNVETFKVRKGIWRTYDATNGLPGAVFCMLQDRQGYLWLGTLAGLCRYDGAEFITYAAADGLADNRILALCEDSQGRLWIGTGDWFGNSTEGGGVCCFDGKQFTNYTRADGLAGDRVDAICEDSQGRLWIGADGGISCFDGKQFTTYTTAQGLACPRVRDLCEDSQGRLWIVTAEGISCFDGQQFTTYITADGSADARDRAICEDRQGRLWFALIGSGAYCFDGQQFTNYTSEDGLVDNFVASVCEDYRGRLWFGTWNGVSCFDGSRFISYTNPEGAGLWSDGVIGVMEDQEKQLWFIHGELGGLSCFNTDTVQLLTDQPVGWAVVQDKGGRIWFSSARELYGIYLDPESSEVQQRKLPFSMSAIRPLVDSRDQFWIWSPQYGLCRYDSSDAAWEAAGGKELPEPLCFRVSDDLTENNVIPLLEAKDGTIWFDFRNLSRLSRFEPEQLPDGEPLESIDVDIGFTRIIEDSQGRLWVGGWHGGGLSCWDGSELTTYIKEDGLPSDSISSLVEDDAGRIWVGTAHGLCYFDGEQFGACQSEFGIRDLYHLYAVKDESGQLWFATRGGGIYRTDGEHLQRLTEKDGLPSNYASNLLPQQDGSMIICTARGVVRYQPTAAVPPGVEIREVVADKVYENREELELTTTAADLLTISYHGLGLATYQMRYSYILEGYDKEWRETWERRVRYEDLPVGDYTFSVIAINRDLVASESPAILKLKVVPDPRDVKINLMQTEIDYLRREAGSKYQFQGVIGRSAGIRQVRALMERAIDSGMTVLVTGETGTGKELIAKAIHYNSPRRDRPLLDRNCGAIPRELLASDLFGHRKGAFTGASEDKMGLFEAASGGTVLLDEISEMPKDAQVHLLRVLEERKVRRLGENVSRDLDVRIIAMTNRDLMKEVAEGRFREDLFHRLNEFPIPIPPLREHPEDILPLAEHFLREYSEEQKKEIDGFGSDVIDMLQSYPWPGNVRELKNAVRRAAALAEEGKQIQTYHFSSDITQGESLVQETFSQQAGYSESVDRFRRRLIERTLRDSGGNRSETARRLGMDRSNLGALMKRLGIKM